MGTGETEAGGRHADHARVTRRAVLHGATIAGASAFVARKLLPERAAHALRAPARPRAAVGSVAPPAIVPRAQWGADESRRRGAPEWSSGLDRIIVHHTGTANGVADWAAQLRAIYASETANGYQDLAYHYLIDPNGVIYEGRWSRSRAPGETPDATDGYGRIVLGAHARGHNRRTLGVALMGDYTTAPVSPRAADALAALLAWQCGRFGLDPLGSGPGRGTLPNICPHGATSATLCPGGHLERALPAVRADVAARLQGAPRPAAGSGEAGAASAAAAAPAPAAAAAPRGPGFWLVAADGRTAAYGNVAPIPRAPRLHAPLAGVAASPHDDGFWAYALDGGVFTFGGARFHGSLADERLHAPIVAMDATATGDGYWLAGSDGGVFCFGDAHFHGSVSRRRLTAPIVAMARTVSGDGYVLVGADGGVFCFGDAHFHGSVSRRRLHAPAVDIATTARGYWIAARDGGVFSFGDARFHGSAARRPTSPVVALGGDPDGSGYVLLTADGHPHQYGKRPFRVDRVRRLPAAVGIAPARGRRG